MSVTKAEMERAIQTAIDKAVAPLATKEDLKDLRNELKDELKNYATKDDLRETEQRLASYIDWKVSSEMRHSTSVIVEQIGSYIRVLDDKYKQLPDDAKLLRADLDAHVADPDAHEP